MPQPKQVPNASALIDEYVRKSQPFARPICRKIREIILKSDPGIIEDWKWGPNYYKNGMICGFGTFQKHVHLAFFRGDAMKDSKNLFVHGEKNRHNRGIKFTDVSQINAKILATYIKEAVRINEKGIGLQKKIITLPADFKRALEKNKKAGEFFSASSYTNRKEFVGWITGAKREETRERRLKLAVQKLARGKKFS